MLLFDFTLIVDGNQYFVWLRHVIDQCCSKKSQDFRVNVLMKMGLLLEILRVELTSVATEIHAGNLG
jgi:hypothetical protein